MEQLNPSSPPRSPMRSSAPTLPPNPAKSFFFRQAHLPSTCSRVMPTAAINSARSSKPSLNEKEVQNAKAAQIQTEKTPRHRCAPAASNRCDHRRLWRPGRTEHETFACVIDRTAAPRRRGGRHHRVQRDQNASGVASFKAVANYGRNRLGRDKATNASSQSSNRAENEPENTDKSLRFGKNLRCRE